MKDRVVSDGTGQKTTTKAVALDPSQLDTDLDLGSLVQTNILESPMYGVIRWIGHKGDPKKPIAGLELVGLIIFIISTIYIQYNLKLPKH